MEPYHQIDLSSDSEENNEIIIALLSTLPFESFSESEGKIVSAFIPSSKWSEELKANLEDVLNGVSSVLQIKTLDSINWNTAWESRFEPVEIDTLARIRAVFHPTQPGFKYDILIQPRMAFGTGHHATTYMMIKLMDRLELEGKAVFDFGCGTGILAVMASLMGAQKVIGNDVDDWAIENSYENAELNHVSNVEFSLQSITSYVKSGLKVNVVLANIQLDVLDVYAESIKALLYDDGRVLLSGVLASYRKEIEYIYKLQGFHLIAHLERDGWICQMYSLSDHR